MSNFTVYPAIDLRFGRVVRLRQGKGDQQTVYSDNPEVVADDWIKQGAEWLHIVNLNGAFGEATQQNEEAIQGIIRTGMGMLKIRQDLFIISRKSSGLWGTSFCNSVIILIL